MTIQYLVTHIPTHEQWIVNASDEIAAKAYVFSHMKYDNEYRGDTLRVTIWA